jgi:hypothetical protein
MNIDNDWQNEWKDHDNSIKKQDDLKFALQCINWDYLTQSDLERVKALCVKNHLMDKDGNWFQ